MCPVLMTATVLLGTAVPVKRLAPTPHIVDYHKGQGDDRLPLMQRRMQDPATVNPITCAAADSAARGISGSTDRPVITQIILGA